MMQQSTGAGDQAMDGPFECHELPNGSTVWFRPSDHAYFAEVQRKGAKWTGVQAQRLVSVTTAIKPLDYDPSGLMRWACRQELEGVATLAADGLSLEEPDDIRSALHWLQSGESVRDALTDARLLHTDRSEEAAARGTNIHKHALHALATGAAVPDMDAMTVEERGYALGIMAFWHEHEPVPVLSEQIVCSKEHRVVGRPDLIAMMDGRRVLVDAKTSASSFVPAKHHAQLALYDLCAEACGVGGTDAQLILMVNAEGGYEPVECQATHEDALAALAVYRAAGRINSACARARKAAA